MNTIPAFSPHAPPNMQRATENLQDNMHSVRLLYNNMYMLILITKDKPTTPYLFRHHWQHHACHPDFRSQKATTPRH